MKNKKVVASAVIAILLLAVVLALVLTQGKPTEPETVKFGYRPISPSLDFFVAMEKGYFKDEGINVDIQMFRGSSDLVDAVVAGKVDFASDLGMVTQLLPIMRTGEYKVLFLSLDLDALDSPMRGPTLVVKKGIGVSKIADLKGKNIGMFPDANFKIFLEALLKKHGIDIDKDVTVTQIPPQEQMAAFKSIDALFSLDPITSGIETKYGAVALSDRVSARYIFDDFPAAASCVNAAFAQKNPTITAKISRVISRGIDFVREHPDQTTEILAKWTNLPLDVAKTMQPVKYAKINEIDVMLLQKTLDYLKNVAWLNVERNLEASRLVWKEHN